MTTGTGQRKSPWRSEVEYRWNMADNAAGFDAAAELIHPYYLEVQDRILQQLPFPDDGEFILLDAGGGSGRFVQRFLQRFANARTVILDQSEAFLRLARERLKPFGDRALCVQGRLQEDWTECCPEPPLAIVSMSAIHHLDSEEKQAFYRRCYETLAPGGVFLNGDEVRPVGDADYLEECRKVAAHKRRVMEADLVSPAVCELLKRWEERNVGGFGGRRVSGDDCHETIDAQLQYLRDGGFSEVDCVWKKDLWAILVGSKKPND